MTTTDLLPFTGDPAADRLLVEDPLALLIGFVLDQQVTLQKAFSGPLELSQRIGGLDAKRIAAMDPEALDAVFRERPEALLERQRAGERLLHADLLVEHEADQQRHRVRGDQLVGFV